MTIDDIIEYIETQLGKDLTQEAYNDVTDMFEEWRWSTEFNAIDAYKKRLVSSIVNIVEVTK